MSEVISREDIERAHKEYIDGNRAPWVERYLAFGFAALSSDLQEAREENAKLKTKLDERESFFGCKKTNEDLIAARQEIKRLKARAEKAEAFKQWVHDYLDKKGVPAEVQDEHLAAGCRIGGRMDWVFRQRDETIRKDRKKVERIRDHIERGGAHPELTAAVILCGEVLGYYPDSDPALSPAPSECKAKYHADADHDHCQAAPSEKPCCSCHGALADRPQGAAICACRCHKLAAPSEGGSK